MYTYMQHFNGGVVPQTKSAFSVFSRASHAFEQGTKLPEPFRGWTVVVDLCHSPAIQLLPEESAQLLQSLLRRGGSGCPVVITGDSKPLLEGHGRIVVSRILLLKKLLMSLKELLLMSMLLLLMVLGSHIGGEWRVG